METIQKSDSTTTFDSTCLRLFWRDVFIYKLKKNILKTIQIM